MCRAVEETLVHTGLPISKINLIESGNSHINDRSNPGWWVWKKVEAHYR